MVKSFFSLYLRSGKKVDCKVCSVKSQKCSIKNFILNFFITFCIVNLFISFLLDVINVMATCVAGDTSVIVTTVSHSTISSLPSFLLS